MGKDYAIVIGINDYPKAKGTLKQLYGAIADANNMYDWLLKKAGLDEKKCELFVSDPQNPTPIQKQVDETLDKFIDQIKIEGRGRRLFFYFAGHGVSKEKGSGDTLCMADYVDGKNFVVWIDDYKTKLIELGYFEQLIFFADCCRTWKTRFDPSVASFSPTAHVDRTPPTQYYIAFATQIDQPAYEVYHNKQVTEKRGIFSSVLLNALNGLDTIIKGEVDTETLRSILVRQIPLVAKVHGYKQDPEIQQNLSVPVVLLEIDRVNLISIIIKITDDSIISLELRKGNNQIIKHFPISTAEPYRVELPTGLYSLTNPADNKKFLFEVEASTTTITYGFH